MRIREKSVGTAELHYSTKKRHHVLGIPENIRVSVLSKKDQQWDIEKFLDVHGKEISIRESSKLKYTKVTESVREVPMRSLLATASSCGKRIEKVCSLLSRT